MKKIIALFLSIAMLLSVSVLILSLSAASAQKTGYDSADDVVYVKSGQYIANWGARDEDCVFLSTYAQDFYKGDNAFNVLSQIDGGTTQSNAPQSALYDALHDVMADAHSFYTYYDGNKNVRQYYKYTDCTMSDTSKVSLIYKGYYETSNWNGGSLWNQEHCWPQSKLSSAEQIGDIMHLRPSNPNENSTRGNKAYGESGAYYDPNKNGQDIHGDCARMMLYMYVRWERTGSMWGTSGVMENLDVLLKWMQEDPVDTWEMGRNDAVQSITGTRNVFVDYPEYAWLLFGKEIPAGMVTPSGVANDITVDTEETTECTHASAEWTVIVEPTAKYEGLKEINCPDCGFYDSAVIQPTGDSANTTVADTTVADTTVAETTTEVDTTLTVTTESATTATASTAIGGCSASMCGGFALISLLSLAAVAVVKKKN